MNLKTASLIALIGVVVSLILSLFAMAVSFLGPRFGLGFYLSQVLWLLNMFIFDGCLILFLAVFYARQQS